MDACAPVCDIIVCTRCRDPRTGASAAHELVEPLAGDEASLWFRVETIACMAGCHQPLAVAFRAPGKATYLFGGIDPSVDVAALLSFGETYRSLPDGWCNESQRPPELGSKTLARVPVPAGEVPA